MTRLLPTYTPPGAVPAAGTAATAAPAEGGPGGSTGGPAPPPQCWRAGPGCAIGLSKGGCCLLTRSSRPLPIHGDSPAAPGVPSQTPSVVTAGQGEISPFSR